MRDDAMLFLFACSYASNILGTIVEHNMCKSSIPWCYCRIYLNTQLYVQLDQRFVKWCRLDSVPALGTIWCQIIFTTLYSIINESPEHWIGEHVRPSYAYWLLFGCYNSLEHKICFFQLVFYPAMIWVLERVTSMLWSHHGQELERIVSLYCFRWNTLLHYVLLFSGAKTTYLGLITLFDNSSHLYHK